MRKKIKRFLTAVLSVNSVFLACLFPAFIVLSLVICTFFQIVLSGDKDDGVRIHKKL